MAQARMTKAQRAEHARRSEAARKGAVTRAKNKAYAAAVKAAPYPRGKRGGKNVEAEAQPERTVEFSHCNSPFGCGGVYSAKEVEEAMKSGSGCGGHVQNTCGGDDSCAGSVQPSLGSGASKFVPY